MLFSSLLFSSPSFLLCFFLHPFSSPLRWVKLQRSKSRRRSSASVSFLGETLSHSYVAAHNHINFIYTCDKNNLKSVYCGCSWNWFLYLHVHGIDFCFCSHQRSFSEVLPPSQRCDWHEGLGFCSQQGQQNHCEWNTHTCTLTWHHKHKGKLSVIDKRPLTTWVEEVAVCSDATKPCPTRLQIPSNTVGEWGNSEYARIRETIGHCGGGVKAHKCVKVYIPRTFRMHVCIIFMWV